MQASSVDKVSELQVLCGGIQCCLLCRAAPSASWDRKQHLLHSSIDTHSKHALLYELSVQDSIFLVVAVPVLVLVPGFLL